MYVCICNKLNDKAVSNAIDCGARSADDIYTAFNVQQKCGQCVTMMDDMIDSHVVTVCLKVAAQ